jgi:hypothetical protein
MTTIEDIEELERFLQSTSDTALRLLLRGRCNQLLADTDNEYDLSELVRFILVDLDDSIADIEAVSKHPIVTSPSFEWVVDHGGWLEGTTILSDDGFGIILLVPDCEGIDATLLALLRDQAVQPQTIS